jgi:uncharacterized metal-binding protein YceD (DUF177 family)
MPKKKKEIAVSEWSFPVEADTVVNHAKNYSLTPSVEQVKRLAQRLGVLGIKDLSADITLERDARSNAIIHAQGTVHGKLTQQCVVTLEPIVTQVEEEFEAWFADPEQAVSLTRVRHDREAKKGKGEKPVLDESEDPEAIIDGKIDLGELATQYLSLAIDPYPHKEGVQYEIRDEATLAAETPEIRKNPFAALKDWKSRKD